MSHILTQFKTQQDEHDSYTVITMLYQYASLCKFYMEITTNVTEKCVFQIGAEQQDR